MYFTIDVYLWMLYREFHKIPILRREEDYIVARSEDRQNYEEFRELIFNSNYPEYHAKLSLATQVHENKGYPSHSGQRIQL